MRQKSIRFLLGLFVCFYSNSKVAAQSCELRSLEELKQYVKKAYLLGAHFESAKKHSSASDEWQNPALDVSYLARGNALGSGSELAMGLSQTIELGGERESRRKIRKSEADLNLREAESRSLEKLRGILLRYHSAQKDEELAAIYRESISSFKVIARRLEKLPAISSEKRIEKEALELAIADYGLKQLSLEYRFKQTLLDIQALLGGECQLNPKIIEDFKRSEKLLDEQRSDINRSNELKQLQNQVDLAQAHYELEAAKSVPDFKIGPQIEIAKENGINDERYGFTLSLDLPLLNWNSRQLDYTSLKLTIAKREEEIRRASKERELSLLKEKYRTLKSALTKKEYGSALHEKHHQAEKLFKKGVISTGLIIEVHRQLIELMSSRQEIEKEAMMALWLALESVGEFNQFQNQLKDF